MFFCKNCNKSTIHLAEATNHVLHLILSILTVGLWIPIWIFVSFSSQLKNVGDCTVCGGLSNKSIKPSNAAQSLGYLLGKLFRKISK
jgi:hypothetical protein